MYIDTEQWIGKRNLLFSLSLPSGLPSDQDDVDSAAESCRVWLVTAASSSHYVSMMNLVISAAAQLSCGHMVLWDIGLDEDQWDRITAFLGNSDGQIGNIKVELKKFEFSKYPAHASLEERTYAWKVLAFNEVGQARLRLWLWLWFLPSE